MIDEPRSLVRAEIHAEPFLIDVPEPRACVTNGFFDAMTVVVARCLTEDLRSEISNLRRAVPVAKPVDGRISVVAVSTDIMFLSLPSHVFISALMNLLQL